VLAGDTIDNGQYFKRDDCDKYDYTQNCVGGHISPGIKWVKWQAHPSSQLRHFLLAAVSSYSVLCRPERRVAELTAYAYGVAMALTFDEFGMWLHLGGSYWQRASVDAVIVVAALLGLLGFAKSIRYYERHHFRAFICLLVVAIGFAVVLIVVGNRIGHLMGPKLRELELQSSP
jgi:hypothetical protein